MTMPFRKMRRLLLIVPILMGCFSSKIFAQSEYPTKPITFIVPYGPGGGADSRSRQIGQQLSILLKTPVIVENKAGAGGNIGTDYIAKAPPDGYTIGMGNFAPLAVNKALFKSLRYDPEKDLAPIILIERGPLVLVVQPNSSYYSINDVIKDAKAKPGKLTFASGGIGGSHQLSAELFEQSANIEMIHVPYKSGAAALTDLMGGSVNMMFDQMYSAMPSIKAGKLRPIAITSKTRSPLLRDIPSFTELGFPQIVVNNWQGLIAPKGTPKVIIDKLNLAVNQILKDPQIREFMLQQGNEVGGGTPEEFAALIKAESIKWSEVVKTANIEPQ
jgi:tripartite-type tricarboxylate transporter receptor subunit TctC